jgi:hypothetical protein
MSNNRKRCLRVLRFYKDSEDIGDFLIALGNSIKNNDMQDIVAEHDSDTVTIDFNWGGDSGP